MGDTVSTLSGPGLWSTFATVALVTALVFFVVPLLTTGQTPDRAVLRLPVDGHDDGEVKALAVSFANTTDDGSYPSRSSVTDRPNRTKATQRTNPWPQAPTTAPTATSSTATTGPVTAAVQSSSKSGDAPANPPDRSTTADLVAADADQWKPDEFLDLIDAGQDQSLASPPAVLADSNDGTSREEPAVLNLVEPATIDDRRTAQFDTLILPESSLSETPLTATVSPRAKQARATKVRSATASATPERNSEWHAWVYPDHANGRWFRHDQDTNRWRLIS